MMTCDREKINGYDIILLIKKSLKISPSLFHLSSPCKIPLLQTYLNFNFISIPQIYMFSLQFPKVWHLTLEGKGMTKGQRQTCMVGVYEVTSKGFIEKEKRNKIIFSQ
ncbi:hypothetical protein Lalb_Chr05g0227321 [Lupinus albus]|uniref:Uncharacterized protein n=1 Tax=Lupinus albus TaxID=3870 RepID=A0A6A4QK85_LUPAL|nr:hypothetical protein Lalb_Chr05g0227321 [Lupinus albus]